jgi:flagellar basal-body rod modification protein FlgD
MDIASTTSTTSAQASTGTSATGAAKTMGENDFLKLLTAQLQAQNPLNPMDSTGFTAQLAQFSSLEQLTSINTNLKNLMASQTSLQNTMATDLIGKRIKMTGNTVTLNGQTALNYSLQGTAAKVAVSIYDAQGALVRTADLGQAAAGNNSYSWDGKDKNGSQLAPGGQYSFTVAAVDSSGQTVAATPLTAGTVTGVAFDNNMTYLNIDGNTRVQLGDVREIQGGV